MPALAFIFITVVLDMLALGVVIPVLPKLIVDFEGGDTQRAAHVVGLFGTVWAFMQFVCSPVLGALSDRFGRRPVILLSNFGLGLDYVLMALAPTLEWLFVGRIVSGITAATVATAGAYIADVTPPEKRAGAFGLLGTAFGVGFVLGPALGGVLGGVDPRLPFWVSAALSLANGCYGLFVLPESLPVERRVPFVWRRATPAGSLGLLRSRPGLLDLAMVHFLRVLAHVALPSTAVLYVTYRYGWDERAVGLNLAAIGVGSMIVQGGLVRPVVARFGEAAVLVVGLAFGVTAFLVYGLAPTGALFWWGVPLMSLWGLSGPPAQGLMTGLVGASEQGRLQGAAGSLAGIAEMIGPGLFTMAFAIGIGDDHAWELPGAAFVLAAAMLVVATGVAWRATRVR
jgi:DHA1 family tetracycline resistance protein-like MFS transporter